MASKLQNAAEIAAGAGIAPKSKRKKSNASTPPALRSQKRKRVNPPPAAIPGRPTLYRPEMDRQAFKLCLLGYTNKELAAFFDIAETTLNDWVTSYPSFGTELLRGREQADAEVAERYYQLARGYVHRDVVINMHQRSGEIVKTRILKHYPPNEKAASTWLRNRQPNRWRADPLSSGIHSPEEAARLLREALAAMTACEEGEGATE